MSDIRQAVSANGQDVAPGNARRTRLGQAAKRDPEQRATHLHQLVGTEKNIGEGLTVFDLRLTEAQRKRLRTSNSLENLNQQIKMRTSVARLIPNEASLLKLASAVLMEISEESETGRRYDA